MCNPLSREFLTSFAGLIFCVQNLPTTLGPDWLGRRRLLDQFAAIDKAKRERQPCNRQPDRAFSDPLGSNILFRQFGQS